jgi:hypothetical protein
MNKLEDADEERALWHEVRSSGKRIDALVVCTQILYQALAKGHASEFSSDLHRFENISRLLWAKFPLRIFCIFGCFGNNTDTALSGRA